jgi:hypothetical protein
MLELHSTSDYIKITSKFHLSQHRYVVFVVEFIEICVLQAPSLNDQKPINVHF